MNKIKFLPHTADIALQVEADSVEELFEGALRGMGNILKKSKCNKVSPSELSENIRIRSVDLTSLLVEFLSEVLTLSFTERALFCRMNIRELTDRTLEGRLEGLHLSGFDEDIKAVTYHGAEVKRDESGKWKTNIIFDI